MTDVLNVAGLQLVSDSASSTENAASAVADNFQQVCKCVQQAARQGSQLVILPENALTFGSSKPFSLADQQLWLQNFSDLARRHKVWLVAGSLPLALFGFAHGDTPQDLDWPENLEPRLQKPFSTCVTFDAGGAIAGVYRKMHLFDAQVADTTGRYRESDTFQAGQSPCVVDTPWGKLGLAICYDLRFPEYFRQLRAMGALMVAIPSAFTWATGKAHWETLLRARAIENQLYVMAVNQGGDHGGGRKTWGDTMVVDHWGQVLARAGNQIPQNDSQLGECIVSAQLDFKEQKKVRAEMPVWDHRRVTGA